MKRFGYATIGIGVLLALVFAFADRVGLGRGGPLGAAQVTGIEAGGLLVLLGVGLLTIESRGWEWNLSLRLRAAGKWILSLPTITWVVATFLALYLALFIAPVFFSHSTIHYFDKYIPNAFVTRIGYDVEQTVTHIQAWLSTGISPYADGIVPYSPLALLVFSPFVVLGYPLYFEVLALITVTFFILGGLLLPLWLRRKKETSLILLFFVMGLFSYGFQFELERGQFNVIAFVSCLLAIYIFHRLPNLRYFAYVLFCLAVQLKLYPAIFVVMFVSNWRDWKGNLKRFAGLALANFALLFILGYGLGVQYIAKMIARQGHFQSSRTEDLSISGFMYHLTTDGFGFIPAKTVSWFAGHAGLISISLLAVFLACFFAVLWSAYRLNRPEVNLSLLAVCTMGAMFIPAGSFDYKLPILVAPLALFLTDLKEVFVPAKKIVSILLIVILSAAYWSTLYPFTVKPALVAGNFPALYLILICVTSLHFLSAGTPAQAESDSEGAPTFPETGPNVPVKFPS